MPPTRFGLARPICSFCDDLSLFPNIQIPSETRHRFFHRKCSTCEPQQDKTLCDFCRHLRIRHLFFCDLTPDWRDDSLNMENAHFDLNISPSQSCPFCQLLACIINQDNSYFPGNRKEINKRPKSTYLRLIENPVNATRLGLCVGLVFYRILSYEDFCGWEPYDQTPHVFVPIEKNRSDFPPHVGKMVQWDKVKGWLKESTNNHSQWLERRPERESLPNGFMLIDVKERKIVNGDKGCQFAALSYVWGDNPDDAKLRATKKTMNRLQRRNGVSAHELPATIEDAIQICIELGKQYLWVDRLCIVQDDDENKQHQINRMASIYASASLVIVVTEGDMESGIAGVRHERLIQTIHGFSGSKFSYHLPSFGESIEHSRWATRGWTYQEAVLAKKKLFFSPAQVYYMCESDVRPENCELIFGWESFTQKSMKLHPGNESQLASWGHHLEAYTARSLRHSSDIYNAFIGICSAIYNEDDPLLCGLPRQRFDQALLWCCTTSAQDAPPHQLRTPEKDEDLPSWSWSSVMGKVSLNGSGARDREFCGSLVEWAVKRSGDSHLERVWYPQSLREPFVPRIRFPGQFYLAVAWSQGCLKKPWPFPRLSRLEFSWLDQFIKTRWTSVDIFARDHIWGLEKDLEEKLLNELQKNRSLRDKTLLVSRAQTARFRLKKHRPHSAQPHLLDDPKHYLLEVIDDDGHCIGMLVESEPRVKDREWPDTELDTFEFVALSISQHKGNSTTLRCILQRDEELRKDWEYEFDYICSHNVDIVEEPRGMLSWRRSRNLTFYDGYGVPLDPVPVVNVMLIGRDRQHSRLAHRVSIGWILLAQWAKAERQFRTIILE